MLNDSPFSEKIKKKGVHVTSLNKRTYIFVFKNIHFFVQKTEGKTKIEFLFLLKKIPCDVVEPRPPDGFLAAARRDCAYDANKQA